MTTVCDSGSDMRVAALGDIHSNASALSECLKRADALGARAYAFLGDFVSDCAQPRETMDILYALAKRAPCFFVRGNREESIADYDRNRRGWEYGTRTGSLLYTYESLAPEDVEFFRGLPRARTVRFLGLPDLLLCHGSPLRSREELLPGAEETKFWAEHIGKGALLCGHTHRPFSERYGGALVVNAGSVGVPCDGSPEAQFALLIGSGGEWRAELQRVPYDFEAEIRLMLQCGLPEKAMCWARIVAAELRTGREYSYDCIRLARSLANQAGCPEEQPVPESFWTAAADRLRI